MNAMLFFRIAAVVAFVQFVAHTYLLTTYKAKHGADEIRVVEAMREHRFDFGGARPHSYWEMYFGYGLFAAIDCLIEALLFWFAASYVRTAPGLTQGIAVIFILANLTHAILVWRYFFYIPLVADVIIAICLAAAMI